ncbi:hypothetical protein EVA_13085 [gut metagenome]|uniref:Uncharacterized protein n=1 Tax=gut metagenome TaxID=749906 RepID=J9FWA6_9ZZZZ
MTNSRSFFIHPPRPCPACPASALPMSGRESRTESHGLYPSAAPPWSFCRRMRQSACPGPGPPESPA